MADPLTVNVGLAVPLRGSNVGTWDTPVNADFGAIDGMFAGVANIGLSSTPVTLTSPSGFTPTPGAGPVQSQNAVLQFSGALTANVTVTLPTPGVYVLVNMTTGNFLVSFRALGSGEVIATPQGSRMRVYCDGTNVRFINLGRPGELSFEGGEIAVPAWIAACSVRPYLLCDGSVHNIADYPYLGAKYGSKFGGNGATTFGVQDLQGRLLLPYDGTGTRITTAGCGIDGQLMGGAGGKQNQILLQPNLPNVPLPVTDPGHGHALNGGNIIGNATGQSGGGGQGTVLSPGTLSIVSNVTGISVRTGGSDTPVTTMVPAQVSGIWLVKT